MNKILIAVFLAVTLLGASFAGAQAPAPAPAPVPAKQKPAWLEYKTPYVGEENDIANPHRTSDEISTWAQQAAADVLTFGNADYKEKLMGFKKYFVQQGWQLYTTYLKNEKFINMVAEDGYSVGAIVNDVPEIVSQGPTEGAYHWIVKMPITISFFSTDAAGYTKTGASGKYILFMDILRVTEGGGDNAIAIDNWRVDPAVAP